MDLMLYYKNSNLGLGNDHYSGILTSNLYKVHEKPFFNYSGSVYLSFLLKGTKII